MKETVALGTCVLAAVAGFQLSAAHQATAVAAGHPLISDGESGGCYDDRKGQGARVEVFGSGWQPDTTVALRDTGRGFAPETVTTDAHGDFRLAVQTPKIDVWKHLAGVDTLRAEDRGNLGRGGTDIGGAAASDEIAYTRPGAFVSTGAGAYPARKVQFRLTGFADDSGRVYGHYFLHGRLRGSFAFGFTRGPCAVLKRRAYPYAPSARPQSGAYRVIFDQQVDYTRHFGGPSYTLRLRIR